MAGYGVNDEGVYIQTTAAGFGSSRAALHAGVENLGDKLHFEHLNSLNPFLRTRVPEPGRNLFVSLTTSW